jgi:V-type H+-transporting ATPase subunit d
MELSMFNIQHGFSEALVRGLRSGFLGVEDYRRLGNCDTLEDLRSSLEETDYGTFLQDEPAPLLVSTISKKCYEKLADEFQYVKAQTVEPLTTFMDFIAREKMIDNVCMIVQGALNNKAPAELQEKIHPLGKFEGMNAIMSETFDAQGGFDDVYQIFLVQTPIGPYFEEFLKEAERDKEKSDDFGKSVESNQVGGILTKQDLEIMKATLKKAWLEDFFSFISTMGGTTLEIMGDILKKEADYRVLLVTLNALNTNLSTESKLSDRNSLYPNFGYLYPEGSKELRKAWNETTVRTALEQTEYLPLFDEVKQFYETDTAADTQGRPAGQFQSIEDIIYKKTVRNYEMAFEQQYHFGVFYAWVKLREQEIRNIRWIANMVILNTKDHIEDTIVPIFQPRM